VAIQVDLFGKEGKALPIDLAGGRDEGGAGAQQAAICCKPLDDGIDPARGDALETRLLALRFKSLHVKACTGGREQSEDQNGDREQPFAPERPPKQGRHHGLRLEAGDGDERGRFSPFKTMNERRDSAPEPPDGKAR
jgi:hypothetical protein